ncbi:hypothetical protein QMK19_07265 [Streptomyces sp. H10-C2]|uniref:hypothetical protein n=1 Tax=unclassified Streptomyces TaxID=2593676 RepID=UPI0024BA3210|nr:MULTISPECIES: hypothetical protein [unclassified Streptomyces]MDJ0341172.1 hypothetical protein [Streptomyces sp. PH10-H1]MDJ0369475.1 hypothetical protein [Streptomyces sp. H10-C2]
MSEFIMPAVPEMQEYLGEVAEELVTLFGISRAEAVARINQAWGHQVFDEWPDLLAHEDPEHWAYGLYYEGDVPYWEPDADRSPWRIRQAPPRDSPAWTLEV